MPSTRRPITRRLDRIALLAVPAVLVVVMFMLIPMGIALVESFRTANPYGGAQAPWTLGAYIRFVYDRDLDDVLVFDPTYLGIFARSFVQAGLTTVICLALGLPLGWYMATRRPGPRQLLVLMVTIPFWTNLLIRIYCWELLLRDQGLVNQMLLALGLIKTPITFLYSDGAILMGLVYSNVPFMALPIYAALEKVDPRLIEAAHDLYAGRWAILRTIVWPLARPGVAAGAILVFVPTLGAFLAPDLLGGGKKLMIGSLIQQQFASARDWPFGAALSMILMAIVLGHDYGRRLASREPAGTGMSGVRPFDWRRMPELRLASTATLIFLYAPLIVLIVYAFNANRLAFIWGGFSTRWFTIAWGNADLRRAAVNSLIVAGLATPVSTLLAVPAALAFERGRLFPGRAASEALIAMPLIAPEIVTAIATLVFFEAIGLRAGPRQCRSSPTRCFACRLPSRCCRSARACGKCHATSRTPRAILYATPWQVFSRITLPLMMPAILAGATLTFVVSLDDFLITLMVAPAGGDDAAGLHLRHAAPRRDARSQRRRDDPADPLDGGGDAGDAVGAEVNSRHCKRSEATQGFAFAVGCFAALAMTAFLIKTR